MDTILHGKGCATQRRAYDDNRHVWIKCAIGLLMKFNIGGCRKSRHRSAKPYPVYKQPAGCERGKRKYEQHKYTIKHIYPIAADSADHCLPHNYSFVVLGRQERHITLDISLPRSCYYGTGIANRSSEL